jgi:indolepyruvate ferredoxin oxidoreductase beta subunit
MNMQIVITGRGGQGVLFLTRLLSECALHMKIDVLASETHGMAMRGGSVLSTVKVGDFRGPLIGSGRAEIMLALDEGSYESFLHLLSPRGTLYLNARSCASHPFIDATGRAAEIGSPLMANLVLLGFALRDGKLFCDYAQVAKTTASISPRRFQEANLRALQLGYSSRPQE